MQSEFMLTIAAWDFVNNYNDQEIDAIVISIPFEDTQNEVNIEQNGANAIGWFNYSYRVQNFDNKMDYECSINPVVTTVITSCTCTESVPDHCSTNHPLEGSSVAASVTNPLPTSSICIESVPADSSTDQPLAASSSSLWALIAVTIMLLLTLLVTIIIAICIVRNMSMKMKNRKGRNPHDGDGEDTCPVHEYMSRIQTVLTQ